MTNSRNKGASFERECATKINQWFQEYTGYDIEVKRDLEQYRSGDHGDLIGLPGWTIECKRYNSNGSVFYRREWWEQVVTASLSMAPSPFSFTSMTGSLCAAWCFSPALAPAMSASKAPPSYRLILGLCWLLNPL